MRQLEGLGGRQHWLGGAVIGRGLGFVALAGLFLASLAVPVQAGAEDPTPDHYETTFANIVGIIAAGGAEWYVEYPTDVPTTGTYYAGVQVSTTAAATATLAIAAATFQGTGCTIGAFVADTTATSQASGYFPITTTGGFCYGTLRLTLSASSTLITAVRAQVQVSSDTVLNTLSGTVNVDVVDDTTADGMLTVPTTPQAPSSLTLTGTLGVDLVDDTTADGKLTVAQDEACGATVRCLSDVNSTTIIGTANVNTTEASQLQVDLKFPGSQGSNGGDFFLPVFLWFFALLVFLRLGRLLAAGACTIGLIGSLVVDSAPFQGVALVILLVAVWLEATAHDRIYQRFLNPNSRRTP